MSKSLPAPKTFAPSREDVLSNLAFFFGDPAVPEKLRDYSEHHAMSALPFSNFPHLNSPHLNSYAHHPPFCRAQLTTSRTPVSGAAQRPTPPPLTMRIADTMLRAQTTAKIQKSGRH